MGADIQLNLFFEFSESTFERAQEMDIAQLDWVILEDYNWLFYFLNNYFKHVLSLQKALKEFLIDLKLHVEQVITTEHFKDYVEDSFQF